LGDIRCPTSVLVGAADRLTTPELAREMAGAIPGARLEIIADAGHITPLERPALVAAALAGLHSAI
jgi:pimeloyl-ACP methyl ester carboxylesterase